VVAGRREGPFWTLLGGLTDAWFMTIMLAVVGLEGAAIYREVRKTLTQSRS